MEPISAILGVLSGLGGAIVQRFAEYKAEEAKLEVLRLTHSHEVEMRRIDAELLDKEYAARTQIASVEADGQIRSASYGLEVKRYSSDSLTPAQNWLFVILDFIRGFVRPSLTGALVGSCVGIVFMSYSLLQKNNVPLSPNLADDILRMSAQKIFFLTEVCVTWWFGTRPPRQGKN